MKRIAIASHVALIEGKEYDGIGNVMIDTLSSLTDNFIFVRHSMDGRLTSEIRTYRKTEIVSVKVLKVVSRPSVMRYITEVFLTIDYFNRKDNVDVYIGVDPLNAVAGIILRKLKRVEKVIFYTADYSPNRFHNRILNSIYHQIDLYCVKHADEVWSVSSKIVSIRKKMGLTDDKNIFLPNVPPIEYNAYRNNLHNKFNLITYGIIDKQLDFEGAIRTIANLKDSMPDICLTIVGNGPEERRIKELAEKMGVQNNVDFRGRLPLSATLELASKSGIGLALYTGLWGFNKYGDSTKCREYFHYGLPVISTDTHSTVDEIIEYKAGVVVDMTVSAYTKAIKEIISHYDEYSSRSMKLGKKYEGAHRKNIQRLI